MGANSATTRVAPRKDNPASSSPEITSHLFAPGYNLPAGIANLFGEASGEFRAALMGMGVLLFVITIIINVIARGAVQRNARRKRGA